MNQVAINTNFSDMAKLMGMSVDNKQSEKASTLATTAYITLTYHG